MVLTRDRNILWRRHNRAQNMPQAERRGVASEIGELLWPLVQVAYVGLCIFNGVRILGTLGASRSSADPAAVLLETIWPPVPLFWSPTSDAVLNFLIDAVVVIVGGLIILGSLAGALALLCAALVIALPLSFFLWLASLSLVGALIAGALAVGLVYLGARGAGRLAKKHISPFAESILRPYYALMSHSQACKESEEVLVPEIVDDDEDKIRSRAQELQARHPDLPAVPMYQVEYGGWFEEIKKRVRIQSMERTAEEQYKLARQINDLHAEWLRNLQLRRDIEIAAVMRDGVESEKELVKERATFEASKLRTEQKKLELENLQLDAQIANLRKPPPPPESLEKQIIRKLRAKARSLVKGTATLEKLVREFPEHEEFIRREGKKLIEEIREGKL